jgi:hypothetical protein
MDIAETFSGTSHGSLPASAGFLLGFFFDSEDGCDTIWRNVN